MLAPTAIPLWPLAVEERATGRTVGYCGLVASERTPAGEPELAFELLQEVWGRGLTTEAGRAVIAWPDAHGHPPIGATVWSWNTAS